MLGPGVEGCWVFPCVKAEVGWWVLGREGCFKRQWVLGGIECTLYGAVKMHIGSRNQWWQI